MDLVSRTYAPGRLFGYQIEIDTSARALTGGFYEQGRRGWLQTLEFNEPARMAFKQNDWNHFRIEAVDDSFKSVQNCRASRKFLTDRLSPDPACGRLRQRVLRNLHELTVLERGLVSNDSRHGHVERLRDVDQGLPVFED